MSRRHLLFLCIVVLFILNVAIGIYAISYTNRVLTVAFLDIGQGDAIYIESPSGREVLIDGGPDRSVLRELPKVMGPFDRSLDVVVETHPDADHIGGLPAVFERYAVALFLEPGIPYDTNIASALVASVQAERAVENELARTGMRMDLGRGAYADVLYPDRDVSRGETNDGSIILKLTYGSTCFILTGDAPDDVEEYLVAKGIDLKCAVLKAGHHGSRTSSSEAFLAAVDPIYVVISAGKDNSYGHPHEEVIKRIRAEGATMLTTAEEGIIRFTSDGKTVQLK